MNRFAREMLMKRNRDERNPYGSQGGYVVSGRDRESGYNMGNDYNHGMDYGRGNDYRDYWNGEDYARSGQGSGRGNQGGSNQGGRDGGYGYGVGMFDYNTEDYADYGYDMARGRGRDGHMKLSSKDIKKWGRELENADGTRGQKWQVEQVKQIAQQQGIRFEEYSPEILTAVANMLYSIDCKVLGSEPTMYVKLAKSWLEDDNFDGEPEEKAMLYYKVFVEK